MAEHWDVVEDQASRDDSVSGLPMLGDSVPSPDLTAGIAGYGRLPGSWLLRELVTGLELGPRRARASVTSTLTSGWDQPPR